MLNRGLIHGITRRIVPISIGTLLHADTIAYANSITAVGGTISNSDLNAVDTFVKTIYENNLQNLFRAFYPYAGSDWMSARQALWVPIGVSRQLGLVGTSFDSSDYTRTQGFKGNGTQGFDTGVLASGDINWSYSVYLRGSGNNSSQIGTGGGISDYLAQNFGGNSYYSASGGFADATTTGLYTAQSLSLFRNGSVLNTIETGQPASTFSVYIHGRNSNNVFFQGTDRPIGCVSIGNTKTSMQELIIYNAVQELMMAFGRQV